MLRPGAFHDARVLLCLLVSKNRGHQNRYPGRMILSQMVVTLKRCSQPLRTSQRLLPSPPLALPCSRRAVLRDHCAWGRRRRSRIVKTLLFVTLVSVALIQPGIAAASDSCLVTLRFLGTSPASDGQRDYKFAFTNRFSHPVYYLVHRRDVADIAGQPFHYESFRLLGLLGQSRVSVPATCAWTSAVCDPARPFRFPSRAERLSGRGALHYRILRAPRLQRAPRRCIQRLNLQMTATPNHALQRTGSAVTAPAADHHRLSTHRQVPRPLRLSLSLGSLALDHASISYARRSPDTQSHFELRRRSDGGAVVSWHRHSGRHAFQSLRGRSLPSCRMALPALERARYACTHSRRSPFGVRARMPHRILKGLANGVVETFMSRNNDVSGYWGIGQLYREALDQQRSEVALDLVGNHVVPSRVGAAVLGQYRSYVSARLSRYQMSLAGLAGQD